MEMIERFKRPDWKRALAVVALLLAACVLESSSDWIQSRVSPSLTYDAVAIDIALLFTGTFIIVAPVVLLIWNWLVAPLFEVKKIGYFHAVVVVTLMYWLNAL